MMGLIFDTHCDVLYRLNKDATLNFTDDPRLHVTYNGLKARTAKVQCFALYVSEDIPQELKYQNVLDMIDIFHKQVVEPYDDVVFVTSARDIEQLEPHQIGAALTLEGCDAIGTDIVKLRTFFRLGVRAVGLTWNYANATADGAKEPRGAGLTLFGREVVKENNTNHIWTDVSHLCEASFWDVIELADFPIASHSNAKAVCRHPRNLNDNQIKALIEKDGMMGITFVPDFLAADHHATTVDVIRHIDHVLELGGEKHIGFGSDFDGIDDTPINITSYYDYSNVINECLKHYPEHVVKDMLFGNFYRNFARLSKI